MCRIFYGNVGAEILWEAVMSYLSLIIPETMETEAPLSVIEKAEILSSLRNRYNICRENATENRI